MIEALDRSAGPRSAHELHADLRTRGHKIGLTTVYRALAALNRAGAVHALEHGGGETVYLGCGGAHHVHLVCGVCGLVWDADPAPVHDRLDGRLATAAFHVEEAYGVCGDCRTGAAGGPARRLAARSAAAQVGINTCARRGDLPFGGAESSGLGRSGGTFALDSYTELRAMVHPADRRPVRQLDPSPRR